MGMDGGGKGINTRWWWSRGGLVHKYTEAEKEKFNLKIRYLKDAINHLGLGILHCCTPLVLPAPSPSSPSSVVLA